MMMMIPTVKTRLKASQVPSPETVSEQSEQYITVFHVEGAAASS